MAVDLHPDVVAAIRELSSTKVGRRYDRMARQKYRMPGWKLAAKTTAGEFGGRSTKTGRGVVSSAGARGPAQFIPSTRAAYMKQYGVDPWAGDKQAIKGLMLHQLNTGVAGYNPGDPGYTDYVLGQKLNRDDRRALRSSSQNAPGLNTPGQTQVRLGRRTIPGQSFAAEREAAKRDLLLSGDIDLDKLLAYKASIKSMKDVPSRTERGDISVSRTPGQKFKVPVGEAANLTGKGGIYEVFYDPMKRYWDSGGMHKGAIGGHDDHVHVSADRGFVVKLGQLAQSMGLNVGEQSKFGGKPTGGHAEGSFHYKDMAIDVSGAPAALRKFARIVMTEARRGRGR
jgi:hypothetical protein